jgi:hypothetical protein
MAAWVTVITDALVAMAVFVFLYGHPYVAEEESAKHRFGEVRWRFTYGDDGGCIQQACQRLYYWVGDIFGHGARLG